MQRLLAAASVAALLAGQNPAQAQVSTPATPVVGSPIQREPAGPPAPSASAFVQPVRSGPLPSRLTLPLALEEAAARSPAIAAARAEVAAAEARARQAGYRANPELSVEVENFGGTGEVRGLRSSETTVAVSQRLDFAGRRAARIAAARADLAIARLRLVVAGADLAQSVREQFAQSVAARERLEQADERVEWARELARIAGILVDAGREPPLRGLRARSALAQALAEQEAARAEELAARTTLASLLGASVPVGGVIGSTVDLRPAPVDVGRSLEVRLAEAERAAAAAQLEVQLAERRLDPAVGAGVRHIRETGDFGLVAGVSVPLRIFDRNQGNIAAARQALAAAESRRALALAGVTARGRNAIAAVEAAGRRVEALERNALPEAREALRLAELAYAEGKVSLLELLDARNAYTEAQAALTEARLALALATAELGRIAAQQENP